MDGVCEGKDSSFPLWALLDAFHEQLRRTEGGEEFVFYDGPPFATGLPHYGHILAGTIKDVVTRHQSMRGRYVSRRFGSASHGLPIEFEIDGALGVTNRRRVSDLGIDKYNETCRSIVTKYVVTRSGRWIDFKNGYKTLESVWWVFAQLWEKDLVYKGFKIAGLVAVDDDGCFIEKISDFKGQYKAVDKDIISAVKDKGRLVSKGSIEHSYPFCWRLGTPLICRSVPSWFVKVEKIKDQLLKCNKETYWVTYFVKEKRFYNRLGAHDWAVSRSRFWCTPLPLWLSKDGEEIVVMDSIGKLEKLSGVEVTDLDRHYVDDITIPSKRGPEFRVLKCVVDVFDCWFESGSMPYAYIHYPFENQELFEQNFAGKFVAEGLNQTCGWFYTQMVLSTALFGKPAFKNLICNGLVLAEDGKKMSKSKNNYRSPEDLVDNSGADSLRLYLINSPVVRAESLRFRSIGIYDVVKYVFLPWYNAYRFFVQNAKRLDIGGLASFSLMEQAVLLMSVYLNHCINSATESRLVSRQEMDAYRLYMAVLYLVKYFEYLTNIYVRLNHKRFKGRTGDEDCRVSLSTLYHVLVTTCVLMAPFTPFFTEDLYQNLRKASSKSEDSIHFCKFPSTTGEREDYVEQSVNRMVTIIDLARNIREHHNKALKTPVKEMVIAHPDNEFLEDITGNLEEYVMEDSKKQRQQNQTQPKMENIVTFFVRVEGTSITVRQNLSTTTTKMLVEHACSRKGIRDYDSFAVYLGKVLCDDKLLSDYKVCSNGTIDIRVRGRAGRERRIRCTTFDDEMKDVDRFIEIILPKTLTNTQTQAKKATFLSERSQHYARQVLISLCRVHFRKKCFNGRFNSTQILFYEGRVVFDESCREVGFTEEGCRKDFLVIALLFRSYFLAGGTYPLYVNDLVEYLSTCPLGVNSNSVEAIALLVNHPAVTSFVERMTQLSTLDSMVDRLNAAELSEFVEAVGSSSSWGENFSWGGIATVVPAMLEVLEFDPESEGKNGDSKPAQAEESAYYTEDPRSCLKFSRNYFKHAPLQLFLVKVEAAFSLNLENFLPQLLRDIVMKFKGPPTFDIVTLLGDHVADRKRKKLDSGNLAQETASPAKRPKISFSLNIPKNKCSRMGALSGFQFGRS